MRARPDPNPNPNPNPNPHPNPNPNPDPNPNQASFEFETDLTKHVDIDDSLADHGWGHPNPSPSPSPSPSHNPNPNPNPSQELSRVGQLASAAGLVGSVLGPLIAGLFHSLPGGGDVEQRFLAMSACAGLAHAACAVALLRWMPPMEAKRRSKVDSIGPKAERTCERCATELSDKVTVTS